MDQAGNNSSSTANIVALLWLVSLVVVGFISFLVGKSSITPASQEVAGITAVPTPEPQAPVITVPPNANINLDTICEKSGFSQKKDYLTPYILKEGDTFNSIAESELHDSTRVSELTKLNEDQKNLTVGSTIYLPPPGIKSSNGALFEVSGRLIKKDNASWQISFGGGSTGRGLDIPAYYLKDLPNLENFNIGDCITVFVEDGVKAYSIKKTE